METIEIYGRIKEASGAPVEKANITLMIGNEVLNVCISDSEGTFDHKVVNDPHFLGSELTYIVKKEGYRPETKSIKIEGTKVVLGDIELTKDIQSSPIIIISGNIKDAEGKPLTDARVSFFVGSGEPVKLGTDVKGEFRHEAKKEQAGMELKYKAEKEGYNPKEGSAKVQEAGTSLAITMDPIPPAPPQIQVEKKPDDKKPTNLILAGVALAVILIIAAWLFWPKGAVTIDQFEASSKVIGLGEGSRLTWATTNADNVFINGENVNLSGNRQVNPTKNTTYTLVAQKGREKAEEKLDVIIKKNETLETKTAKIENFEADPGEIISGESAILKWIVSNADKTSIEPKPARTPQETSSGDKRIGQVSVNPHESTTYTFTASNGTEKEAAVTKTVRINVTAKRTAKIDSFEADPGEIVSGESTILRWSVSNADKTSIEPKPAKTPQETSSGDKRIGQVYVNPQESTTYTLTTWNETEKEAAVTKTVRINVTAKRTAKIENFEADPGEIASGESSILRWSVSNADKTSIEPQPAKTPQETSSGDNRIGQVSVNPRESTTYTLTASKDSDKEAAATQTVRINVTMKIPPKIESFEADPSEIFCGGSSTLRWSVSNADRVSIDPRPIEALMGTSDGDRGSGEVFVNPQKSTTYTLTASNDADKETIATESVRINVRQEPIIEPTRLINIDAFPDGIPIKDDIILEGDEYLLCP